MSSSAVHGELDTHGLAWVAGMARGCVEVVQHNTSHHKRVLFVAVGMDEGAFVLDCGSGCTRAGLAGDDAPRVVADTAVGCHTSLQVYETRCVIVLWFDFV